MLYIVGTSIDMTTPDNPMARGVNKNKRKINWIPSGVNWLLGRISKTKDADTVEYLFYSSTNSGRTHTVTFPDCKTADEAIAAARGERIVDETEKPVDEVDVEKKFSQIEKDLSARASSPRRRR